MTDTPGDDIAIRSFPHTPKIGRPTIATPELLASILRSIRGGVPTHTAAEQNGLSTTSVYKWLRIGREALDREEGGGDPPDPWEAPFADFALAHARARADAIARKVLLVEQAARGVVVRVTERRLPDGTVERDEVRQAPDWRAAMALLESADRVTFGRRAETVVTGPGGGPVEVEVGPLLARVRELVAAEGDEGGSGS